MKTNMVISAGHFHEHFCPPWTMNKETCVGLSLRTFEDVARKRPVSLLVLV